MLSETNIRGTPVEHVAHFYEMAQECIHLERWLKERGRKFHGYCHYPFVDSTDWDSLCTRADGHVDPQGIYRLDKNFDRRASEFSNLFRKVAASQPSAPPPKTSHPTNLKAA